MKAERSNIPVSPHGGIVPILYKMKEFGIPQVIRQTLGTRAKQSSYGYDDVAIAWILTALCGGTRIDHITKLKKKLAIIPGLKIPSHDTMGRVMKKLATESLLNRNISKERSAKVRFIDYNDNILLNRMLVKVTKRIGALIPGKKYTLDIDATFLYTQCRGAESRNDNHGKLGFTPLVCLINDMPVFISLRNGDAGARFMLPDSLKTCLDILEENGIKIGRVISDAAGYSKEMIDMLEKRNIKFVMRFPTHPTMTTFNKSLQEANWRRTEIRTANDVWDCEIADITYNMYHKIFTRLVHKNDTYQRKPLRVVAIRFPTIKTLGQTGTLEERISRRRIKKKMEELENRKVLKQPGKKYIEIHWKEIDGFTYKFYVTNDWKKSSEEIVYEYNKRGDAERKFSYMKNEFGWRLPPFMWMEENLVFLILASLANNIFVGVRKIFKKQVPQINLKMRLKDFQFKFINVACAYIDRTYIFYSTDIEYDLLI